MANAGHHARLDPGNSVVLNFEGLAGIGEFLLDFYNGGVASGGSSGTNYGISFNSNVGGINMAVENVLNVPSPDYFMFYQDGPGVINIASGFTTGFSFSYTSSAPGTVNIYDGLNGTGTLLASLPIGVNFQNGGCPPNTYCHWDVASIPFSGTARSIVLDGNETECAFDNLTFGVVLPPSSPVPTLSQWGLIIFGLSLVAFGGIFIMKRGVGFTS